MLKRISHPTKFTLATIDGDIGTYRDLLFDDRDRGVRYGVAQQAGWPTGRKGLISPATLKESSSSSQRFPLRRRYLFADAFSKQQEDPVRQGVVTLLQRSFAPDTLCVTVVDDRDEALGSFATRFADGRFTPIESDAPYPDKEFRVKTSYLRAVVDNADDYMAHPTKLDWDWLSGQVKAEKGQ